MVDNCWVHTIGWSKMISLGRKIFFVIGTRSMSAHIKRRAHCARTWCTSRRLNKINVTRFEHWYSFIHSWIPTEDIIEHLFDGYKQFVFVRWADRIHTYHEQVDKNQHNEWYIVTWAHFLSISKINLILSHQTDDQNWWWSNLELLVPAFAVFDDDISSVSNIFHMLMTRHGHEIDMAC
jgi:hypothetical protein